MKTLTLPKKEYGRNKVKTPNTILEKDGIPIAGIMDIDEFEDYLELQDPKVREHIRKSNEEYLAGKSRPVEQLLAELGTGKSKRTKTARRQKA